MKNRLSELRSEKGIWQEDLAKHLNVSQQKISRYEKGKMKNIDYELEDAICEFFDCSLDYLRCKSNIRNGTKQYQTLKKVADLIEKFYEDSTGIKIEKEQDLSDEQLALFEDWILSVKDFAKEYSRLQKKLSPDDISSGTRNIITGVIENSSDEN